MKIFTLAIVLLLAISGFAQSYSLTVFNNSGQQFFVIMNGIKQNSLPLTNVKVAGLTEGSYEVKLIFADGKTADINKKIYLAEPGDYLARVTFKKGKGKLQYFGTTGGGSQAPGGATNVNYRPNEQAVYSDQPQVQTPVQTPQPVVTPPVSQQNSGVSTTVTNTQNPGNVQSGTTIQSTQTTTTTTQTNGNAPTGGINMNVSVTDPTATGNGNVGTSTTIVDPETGETINVNIGISMSGMGTGNEGVNTQTTTTTTTTTTSSSSSSSNIQQQVQTNGQTVPPVQQAPVSVPSTTKQPVSVTCIQVFTSTTYVDELKKMSFDEDRLTSIRSSLKTTCLTTIQATKILETLTFSGDRLEIAKFMYPRLTDSVNALQLNKLFTFETEKEEFTEFVQNNKR